MKNQIGLHMGYWWGTEASDDLNRILELTAQAELEIWKSIRLVCCG